MENTIIKQADAVVVGGGAAGIVAAYKMAKKGLKVIMMDKGSSMLDSDFSKISGYIGCDTKYQKAKGITIASKKNIFEYLTNWAKGDVNPKLISSLLDHTPEAIELLEEMGLTYSFYSDWLESDKREIYDNDLTWAPLHLINEYGPDRTEPVTKSLIEAGVDVMYNCAGTDLIMEDGKVAGVKGILNGSDPVIVHAKAAFLATGGFGNNKEMMKAEFNGAPLVNMGSPNNTGDGIRMALEAGAVMEQSTGLACNEICGTTDRHEGDMFDAEYRMYNDNLGFALYGGLAVDSCGDRFINEEHMAVNPLASNGIPALSVGHMYVIMDGEYYDGCCEKGIYKYLGCPDWDYGSHLFVPVLDRAKDQLNEAIQEGWGCKADTLAEIGEHFGLTNLEKTVAEYNAMCEEGEDNAYGKSAIFLRPIKEGYGYYAFEYAGGFWCTMGGVKTDATLRALNAENEPVPGIYIGGMEMGSAFGRTYYDISATGSGLSIASGAIAADAIEEYIK